MYVQVFKIAKEIFEQQDVPTDIKVAINETKWPTGGHPRRYKSPLCDEVRMLFPNESTNNRDIVLQYTDGSLRHFQNCTGAM